MIGAFDRFPTGPVYRGGFRPTLGPYGGRPYSELLSVTDPYGRQIYPSLPFDYFAKKSSSLTDNKDVDIPSSPSTADTVKTSSLSDQ